MPGASGRQRAARRRARGLTLVELMVGLSLGMAISVAALRLFADASASGHNLQRASMHIENGRYAVEALREDLELAGFFGEIPVAGVAYTTPDPCETDPSGFVAEPLALPAPVQGLAAGQSAACLASRQPDTDAVLVRRLDIDALDPATLGAGNAHTHLQVSFCDTDAPPGLVAARDPAEFTLRNRACSAPNRVRAYVSRIYFVASCSRCGPGGDQTPTLKRLDLVGRSHVETSIVQGVETLRVEYGFDTDSDGAADAWRTGTAGSGPESLWENVVALKLHAVVRSPEPVSGSRAAAPQAFQLGGIGPLQTPGDGYVRRLYTTTVRLENPSAARERW
jgi:type IV pilus assembly protein PilW